jgi:hypothetical protein
LAGVVQEHSRAITAKRASHFTFSIEPDTVLDVNAEGEKMTRLRFSLPRGRRNPNDEMRPPNAGGSDFVISIPSSFVI